MTTATLVTNGALGILAAPLLSAGAAKLLVRAERLSWPYDSGPLAAPRGPRLVGAAECAAAAAVGLAPRPLAGAVAATAFGALAVAAQRLRGQRCACFGVARLAAVGRGHVAANAAAAAAGAAVAFVPAGAAAELALRGLGLAATTTALVVLLWRLDRRSGAEAGARDCAEPVRSVRVYVSENCPACRSLGSLLTRLEGTRRALVDTVVVHEKESLPRALQGLGVPCAIGLDSAGQVVCSPVSGIGDVKALVDQLVIGLDDLAHAR